MIRDMANIAVTESTTAAIITIIVAIGIIDPVDGG
jgi:hypothetical protein